MQQQPNLKLNVVMNGILTMSSMLFPLVSFPYVSRILQPEGIGKVSFATSIISYFSLFAQLGIPTYGIRACAQVREDKNQLTKTAQEIFLLGLITSIVTYIIFLGVLWTVPSLKSDINLYLVISTTLFFNAIGVEWLYKALEQYTYITIRSILFKFIALIALFIFVKSPDDYVIYGAISVFAVSASSLLNFINLPHVINVIPTKNLELKKHLKAIIVFFSMSCATTIYTHLDTVMLGVILSDKDVGYYNAAIKIKGVLVSLVTSLSAVLLPRISYLIESHNTQEFLNITYKSLRFIIFLSMPLMVYFIIFAEDTILFLSGPAFYDSVYPMRIIMPTVLLIGLTNLMGIQILVPQKREMVVLKSEIGGAIVNLIINALLIPIFASAGAAIGTLIAEWVVWLIQYRNLRTLMAPIYRSIHYMKLIFALLLAVLLSLPIKEIHCSTMLTLILSAFVFFFGYFFVLLFLKDSFALELWNSFTHHIKRK